MSSRRTHVEFRDFACKSEAHHRLRMMVRRQVADDGSAIERTAEFRATGVVDLPSWSTLPICHCGSIAEEQATYDPMTAAVPESERMEVWLAPDGSQVAVPGRRGAVMPDRLAVAGYRRIEAHSMRDIDRIEAIRARQTGNDVFSEMNFDAETRRWIEEREPDLDSMTEL